MSEQQGNYDMERIKLENAALRKYAAIQKASEDKIACQTVYVDITGDIEAAFVLDEIIFFTLPREQGISGLRVWKDGVLWMAVQRAEWWRRKRLTPRQADTAIQKLLEQNLIIKMVTKFNGQNAMHLRLNVPEFFRRYGEELEKANPPEDQGDTLTRDINDLYEMMGMGSELQIRDSQNGETKSRIRETKLQNGDSLNNPHTSSTQSSRKDLVDGYLELSQSPGIKRAARIDSILSYLGGALRINTETKRWKDFARFVDERQQIHKENLDSFISWLTSQKNFDIQFWPPSKMQEMWPQAFTVSAAPLPTVDQMDEWRKGINL
jgi:hypothetical protein